MSKMGEVGLICPVPEWPFGKAALFPKRRSTPFGKWGGALRTSWAQALKKLHTQGIHRRHEVEVPWHVSQSMASALDGSAICRNVRCTYLLGGSNMVVLCFWYLQDPFKPRRTESFKTNMPISAVRGGRNFCRHSGGG